MKMTTKLNQYTLKIHLQKTDNKPLTTKEKDELKNIVSFNLSYALEGSLLYDIQLTKGEQ